jgi:hypothetical protein
MAFRTTTNRLGPDANVSAEIQQSTAVLPLQYDSLLALVDLARRAPQEPLSMCIPLFVHAAFSEVQFLNLMESRIQIQINTIVEGVPADALETLQYFSNILNRHAQQLLNNIRAISKLAERSSNQVSHETKAESPMPRSTLLPRQILETESIQNLAVNNFDGVFTTKGILEDYEQLHVRCIELSTMCTQGITLAMNKVTIEESRKAIDQSERLKKLTLLATLFIPLSFCSSLLGMNIDLLGQNAVKFWWFFVLCIPITLFSYIFYLWDFEFIKRCWAKFCEGCRGIRRDMTAGRAEKDASHIA